MAETAAPIPDALPGDNTSESFNQMAASLRENLKEFRNPPKADDKLAEPDKTQAKPELPKEKPAEKQPEVKPAPAKTEAKPDEDIPPEIKGKAAEHFRNQRKTLTEKFTAQIEAAQKELASYRDKATTLEAEVTTYKKSQVVTPEDLTKLKSERDELLSRLERTALSESPQFQAKYQRAFDHARNQAQVAAGDKKDVVTAILEMPPSPARKAQLGELIKTMDPVDQLSLVSAIGEMDRARHDREAELSNHRQAIQRLNEENMLAATQEQERKKAKISILSQNALQAAQENFGAFQKSDDPNLPGRLTDLQADIEKVMTGNMTESETAMLPVLASHGRYLETVRVPQLEAKIAELEGELKARVAANPEPTRGDKGGDKQSSNPAESSGFIERFKRELKG